MAKLSADLPFRASVKARNNSFEKTDSFRGDVDVIDRAYIGANAVKVELYDIELTFPKIYQSELDSLVAFWNTNAGIPVTTQPLDDGYEYVGYMIRPPAKVAGNAIRVTAKLNMVGWRGVHPGALVHFRENGIVDGTPVTGWTNEGTGGASYDLTDVNGTPLIDWINGLSCVYFFGSESFEPAAAIDISDPVIFVVCRNEDTTVTAHQFVFDAVSESTKRAALFFQSTFDEMRIFSGSILTPQIDLRENGASLETNVYMCDFNGDSSTKIAIGTGESVTGDAGSITTFEFGRIGDSYLDDGQFNYEGMICEIVIYSNDSLSEAEKLQTIASLKRKWNAK